MELAVLAASVVWVPVRVPEVAVTATRAPWCFRHVCRPLGFCWGPFLLRAPLKTGTRRKKRKKGKKEEVGREKDGEVTEGWDRVRRALSLVRMLPGNRSAGGCS